ncbi:TD and POZ domain-containing protein 2-like isoform X1 [Chironomus tepperi]|uniref:TD and POZ domain-containing protein 2-like isoform X1 n=1 Tax=Chironomus tepperi TaxID=113505 RepID=UPI00391F395D
MKFDNAIATRDFEWKIHNFRRDIVLPMREDRYLANRKITILLDNNQTKWNLRFYIKSKEISLLLLLDDAECRNFKARFSCFIPEKEPNYKRRFPVHNYSEKHALYYENAISRLNLTELDELFDNPSNYFIEYDTLTVKIRIELISGFILQDIDCFECTSSTRDFFYELYKLFEAKAFTDFTIICSDGKEIQAHRCILAANSPVLNAMLQTQMMESISNKLVVSDISGDVMEEIMKFMYTQDDSLLYTVNLRDIYYVAEKYQIAKLKEKCISYIVDFMTVRNVLQYFMLGEFYNDNYLILRCVMFINNNYEDVCKNKHWEKLSKKQLDIIKEFMEENKTDVQLYESTL